MPAGEATIGQAGSVVLRKIATRAGIPDYGYAFWPGRTVARGAGMRNVAIVGAGMTPFAEHFDLGIKDLVPMAYAEAVAHVDKGIQKSEIEAAWFGELSTTDGFPSGILADTLDLTDIPVTRVENACATGNDAIRNGTLAIASGLYDVVLVVGADKVRETSSNTTFWEWAAMTRDNAWDYPLGLVAPANFALHVTRYLHESPATKEHMAMVAVKNHFHAVKNPKAQLRYEITVEQALAAPMVVDPFGLYDCTPQSDGAAAVILAAEEVVDRYTDRPVWVRGVGLGMDRVMHQHKADMTTFPPTVRAAKAAMQMAGVTPRDIDVAEVHDCFTGVELISYEDLGFANRFEAYKLVEGREHYVGGSIPINPSGGLKAKGHPAGRHRAWRSATNYSTNFVVKPRIRSTARELPWHTISVGRPRSLRSPSSPARRANGSPMTTSKIATLAGYKEFAPWLLVEKTGSVHVVSINRPEAFNAVNEEVHHAFATIWRVLAADDDVRAVVTTGVGKAFSAGGDMVMFGRLIDDAVARASTRSPRRARYSWR